MENYERIECELLEQCGQIAILEWSVSHGCNDAMNASSMLEELCQVSAPRRWT